MTWLTTRGPSLIDTIGRHPVDWWLVYTSMDDQSHWYARLFRPGFQHVMALRRDGRVWVAVCPYFHFVDIKLVREDATPWQLFPNATIQHVTVMREKTQALNRFHLGPITCVDLMKSLLWIRSWWVRTPWQLYNHCRRVYG